MKYTQDNLNSIKKYMKKYVIIDIVLSCVILGTLVGLGFITKPNNAIWMKVVFSFLLGALVLFIIGTITMVFIPSQHKYDYIHKIVNSNCSTMNAKVVELGGNRTMMRDKTFQEIEVISNEKTYILYFDLDDGAFPFDVNDIVNFEIADNFIVSMTKDGESNE